MNPEKGNALVLKQGLEVLLDGLLGVEAHCIPVRPIRHSGFAFGGARSAVRGPWSVVRGPRCGEQSGVANSLKTPRSPRIVSLRLIDLLQLHHDLSAGQAEEPKKWVLCPRILSILSNIRRLVLPAILFWASSSRDCGGNASPQV